MATLMAPLLLPVVYLLIRYQSRDFRSLLCRGMDQLASERAVHLYRINHRRRPLLRCRIEMVFLLQLDPIISIQSSSS